MANGNGRPTTAEGPVASTPGSHYARTRVRLTALLADRTDEEWDRPVAACPGWRVRDVVAHLAGNVEDALAGRLSGPPDEVQSAEQVARHVDDAPSDVLATWNATAAPFEDAITAMEIWPAAIDLVSHEHDIRAALDAAGARDDPSVCLVARLLIERLDVPGTLTVDLGDEVVATAAAPGPTITLTTTPFEALRLRLGRRTRAQVRALAWSADPEPFLDHVFVFGPAADPVIE